MMDEDWWEQSAILLRGHGERAGGNHRLRKLYIVGDLCGAFSLVAARTSSVSRLTGDLARLLIIKD